jgi:formylglycine-generating enzyme required for sulfatase activity
MFAVITGERSMPFIALVLSLLATFAHAPASAAEAGAVFADCTDCPSLVVVPPGRYLMGSELVEPAIKGDVGNIQQENRYEGPVREIRIAKPFALGETQVTVAQFGRFVADTGHETQAACRYSHPARGWQGEVQGFNWREAAPGRLAMPDEPVGCVSWRDAKGYVDWLARKTRKPYRLPSEAEWEYAARAGRPETLYAWGDDPAGACEHGNVLDRYGSGGVAERLRLAADCYDGWAQVAPVKQFSPNPFGLYDMTGNVWEWMADYYRMPYPDDAPTDGASHQVDGPCDRRGTRGGSWNTGIERQRPTFRGRDPETLTTWIFGFRIARDL